MLASATVGGDPGLSNAPLLRALRGEPVEHIPVWFMRQAGRSLPEYRAVRERATLLEITHSPELTAEVTLQPVRRHGVDAAILFSDIVTPLEAIGLDVDIRPGVGPVIAAPVRTSRDLRRLRPFEPAADAPWLAEAVRLTCAELSVPLIGFAGGPFTLASYLVEGGPSKTQARAKALMLADPPTWRALLEYLADIALASLAAQVQAGAQAVQVFDSWIGSLSARHYEAHVLPVVRHLFAGLAALGVPRIYFGLGTGHLLEAIGSRRRRTPWGSTGACRCGRASCACLRGQPCRATSTPSPAWRHGRCWRPRSPRCSPGRPHADTSSTSATAWRPRPTRAC